MGTNHGPENSSDGPKARVRTGQQLIDESNVFQAGKGRKMPGAYVSVPVWWRRFLFAALDPRTLTVYLQLCMWLKPDQTTAVSIDMLREQSGLRKRSQVEKALDELVTLGFILRESRSLPRLFGGRYARSFFQRPDIKHTLCKLTEAGKVDGELKASGVAKTDFEEEWNDGVVQAGLRSLLGPAYNRYDRQHRSVVALRTALGCRSKAKKEPVSSPETSS